MKKNESLLNEIFQTIQNYATKTGNDFMSCIKQIQEIADSSGGISGLLKMAWNLEEKDVECFSLNECIEWAKNNFDKTLHSSAIVHRKVNDKPDELNKRIELHLCYLDDKKTPLLKGESKHLIVHCNSLDTDLSGQFGVNDVIVFD